MDARFIGPSNCPVCHQGTFVACTVEKWMQQNGRSALARNVPALRCTVCGETTFSQDVAERLVRLIAVIP